MPRTIVPKIYQGEVSVEMGKEVEVKKSDLANQPLLVIASNDPSLSRHLDVTCRSLPESLSLKVICVSSFPEAHAQVASGNVFLLLIDENLLSTSQRNERDRLFPDQPFLQTILWNSKEETLSCSLLSHSMKLANLTHKQMQQWKTQAAAGLWH